MKRLVEILIYLLFAMVKNRLYSNKYLLPSRPHLEFNCFNLSFFNINEIVIQLYLNLYLT